MNEFRALWDDEDPQDFIGRDDPLRELEAAMSGDQPGILVHGLGGVGKTTLARRFARQLLDAQAVTPDRVFWFSLEWDVRTAEYVINHLGIELLGIEFLLESIEKRIETLAEALQQQRCLIIWDNFDVVHGMESAGERAKFRSQDQQHLFQLLKKLRGGNTKVLITSRSYEAWLGTEDCFRMNLGGFNGHERWEYGQVVLSDVDLQVDRTDPQLAKLLDLTDGHPMAVRIMLPQLKNHSAGELCRALETNISSLGDVVAKESEGKLLATLQYVEQSVPESSRPLLAPLALHERFVGGDDLEAMAVQADKAMTRAEVDALLQTLTHAGLLESRGAAIYRMHSVLTRYLRGREVGPSDESWQRAFVDVMASRATSFPLAKGPPRRIPFYLHDSNYQAAVDLADRLCMNSQFCDLLSWLNDNVQNKRDFEENVRPYQQTADAKPPVGAPKAEAAACQKLGMIARQQRDFGAAAVAFRHALEIAEGNGNENVVAITSHALGLTTRDQWDLGAAENLFQRALRIYEEQGDEYSVANIYANIAFIARKQGHFDAADSWIQKARAICESRDDEFDAAHSYHQLGIVAQDQRDFDAAVQWYEKSLAINEAIGNEHGAAFTYHQLGVIAMEKLDFDAVHGWFRRALEVRAKQGNEYDVATTYFQLGVHAQQKRDFDTAEKWLRRSLDIAKQQDNQSVAAFAYHNLAMIPGEQRDLDAAEKLYWKALRLFEQYHKDDASMTYHQLGVVAQQRSDLDAAEDWYRKSLEIDERRGDEHGVASTYQNLGIVAQQREEFEAAEKWLRKALYIRENQGDELDAAGTHYQLGRVAEEQSDFDTAETCYRQAIEIEEKPRHERGSAESYYYQALGRIFEERRDFAAAEKLYRKALEIAETKGIEEYAAASYYYLGRIANEQRDYDAAENWFQKALEIYEKLGKTDCASRTCQSLGITARKQRNFGTAEKWYRKSLEIDEDATWFAWLIFYVRSLCYKSLGVFSK